ncbi:MAG: hypothetical protein WKF95_07660 [Rubrobacter sp.]
MRPGGPIVTPVCRTPMAPPRPERGNQAAMAFEPPGAEVEAPRLARRKRTRSQTNASNRVAHRASSAIAVTPAMMNLRSPWRSIRSPTGSMARSMPPQIAEESSPIWARERSRSRVRTGPSAAGACYKIETPT